MGLYSVSYKKFSRFLLFDVIDKSKSRAADGIYFNTLKPWLILPGRGRGNFGFDSEMNQVYF